MVILAAYERKSFTWTRICVYFVMTCFPHTHTYRTVSLVGKTNYKLETHTHKKFSIASLTLPLSLSLFFLSFAQCLFGFLFGGVELGETFLFLLIFTVTHRWSLLKMGSIANSAAFAITLRHTGTGTGYTVHGIRYTVLRHSTALEL